MNDRIYPGSYFKDLYLTNLHRVHREDPHTVSPFFETPPTFMILVDHLNRMRQTPLLLIGPLGTGKTTIMKAAARTLAATPYRMTIVSHSHLNNVYESEGLAAILEAYGGNDTLVIDDAGNSRNVTSNFANTRHTLEEVFMHRYERGRITHFTTNLLLPDFLKLFSARAADRLRNHKDLYIKERNYRAPVDGNNDNALKPITHDTSASGL
jgi:DNA replication protein DnaC